LYLDAKNRAKPSLHRDSFLAPLARGTGTLPGARVGLRLLNPTAGPLVQMESKIGRTPYLDKFLLTSKFCATYTETPTLNRLRDSFVFMNIIRYLDRFRLRPIIY
jgi:hypothetical protein